MASRNFESILVRSSGTGTWTYLEVPFDSKREFGTKGRIQVKGTLDRHPFTGTLLPDGKGGHFLVVRKDLREAIGKNAGQKVKVTIEPDESTRIVRIPPELTKGLEKNTAAKSIFARMSFSHQKTYADWIKGAKKPETRSSRIKSAIGKIAKGSKLQ